MKKLNPFKPFIVLAVVLLYVMLFLVSCVMVGALMVIPEMPTHKAVFAVGFSFVWFGLVAAVIACHLIVSHNKKAAREGAINGI